MSRSQSGFSFVEILAATAILAIVISPILNSFLFSRHVENLSEDFTTAYFLAIDKMEEIITLSFDEIESEQNDIITAEMAEKIVDFSDYQNWFQKRYQREYEIFPEEFNRFRRLVEVEEVSEEDEPEMKKIAVKILLKDDRKVLYEVCRYVVR